MFDKLKGRLDGHDGLSGGNEDNDQRPSHEASRVQHEDQTAAHPPPPPFNEQNHKLAAPEKSNPPPFSSNFACVSLHAYDKIRLLHLPDEQRDAIRASIIQTWPRGIQRECDYHGSHEFKLRGNPWCSTRDEALHARRLTRGILSTLYQAGWVLYITTDISRHSGDKDNLFFRHQVPAPAPREWFSVAFSNGGRIRLIDAPDQVVQDVSSALRAETQSHEAFRSSGSYEINLAGSPSAAAGGATMASRNFCLKLFSVFEAHGFTLSTSMEQKYGGENSLEADTWHVSRLVGWQRGAPVYHR